MKNLNELAIKNREVDLENGFFFVEFFGDRSLQCCLVGKRDSCDEELYFVEQIEVGNSGHNEGICADVNAWAAQSDNEDDLWDEVELFLIEQARMIGVEIVG